MKQFIRKHPTQVFAGIVISLLWAVIAVGSYYNYQKVVARSTHNYYSGTVVDKTDYCGNNCTFKLQVKWDHGYTSQLDVSAMDYQHFTIGSLINSQCKTPYVWLMECGSPRYAYDPEINDTVNFCYSYFNGMSFLVFIVLFFYFGGQWLLRRWNQWVINRLTSS